MSDDASHARATRDRDVTAAREALAQHLAAHAVTFSEQQAVQLGEALFEAELALLRAVAKEAGRLESFDATRNIPRLVSALQGLRGCMGQGTNQLPLWATTVGTGPGGWFGYSPVGPDDAFLDDDE
jgi:hypothetical protein